MKFFGSFAFNRKRNVLELEIRQDYTSSGTQKYVVSLAACAWSLCQDPSRLKLSDFSALFECFLAGSNQGDRTRAGRLLQPHAADRREQPETRHPLPLEEQKVPDAASLSSAGLVYYNGHYYIIAVVAPENHASLTLRCATEHPESIASA